jgi:hypothetical protein
MIIARWKDVLRGSAWEICSHHLKVRLHVMLKHLRLIKKKHVLNHLKISQMKIFLLHQIVRRAKEANNFLCSHEFIFILELIPDLFNYLSN